jgi:hypothetical protein
MVWGWRVRGETGCPQGFRKLDFRVVVFPVALDELVRDIESRASGTILLIRFLPAFAWRLIVRRPWRSQPIITRHRTFEPMVDAAFCYSFHFAGFALLLLYFEEMMVFDPGSRLDIEDRLPRMIERLCWAIYLPFHRIK